MTMTTKQAKEWNRRLKKMQKHVDALREIDNVKGDDKNLDDIQEALNDMEGRQRPEPVRTLPAIPGLD